MVLKYNLNENVEFLNPIKIVPRPLCPLSLDNWTLIFSTPSEDSDTQRLKFLKT